MVTVILTSGGGITIVGPDSPYSSWLVLLESMGRGVDDPLRVASYSRITLRQSQNSLRWGQQWEEWPWWSHRAQGWFVCNVMSFLGKLTLNLGIFDSGNFSWTKGLRWGSLGQLLVVCPTTLHKAHRGDGFGALGARWSRGALSLGSFHLEFPPCLDAFATRVGSC